MVSKRTKSHDTKAPSGSTTSTGTQRVGVVRELGFVPKEERKAPGGYYRFDITLSVLTEGGGSRTVRGIHLVPSNRTQYIQIGATLPMLMDPSDPARVEIDWANHHAPSTGWLGKAVTSLAPNLKKAGYTRPMSTRFNRIIEPGVIHIIEFQSHLGDFTVDVAVYARRLSQHKQDETNASANACRNELRWRIGHLGPERRDMWWRYDSPSAIHEISTLLTGYVLPHLAQYESLDRLPKP